MFAAIERAQTAMNACQCRSERMPFSMSALCAFASASILLIIRTGVCTSVSLFVLLIVPFLLLGLVVLISLTLIGLTGLIRLESLVGLKKELVAMRTARGD